MRRLFLSLAFGAAVFAPQFAWASSDDAWATFRRDVADKCLAAVEGDRTVLSISVGPFGTENFGVALIETRSHDVEEKLICVYDKQSRNAEVGGPLAPAMKPDGD